ncbi:hypothetical protein [Helicobacter sp. 11S02596-1]|uniref:hypothetical protein n=1 Tax=Helicobacter sp. 11S02596-1 TaxID=1476194 RepID=UPI000BA7C298|nr:hypothetical protein [Helicobacter sp. 11S02596-1]PAF42332.1 hypothetical protein BJI48_06860 [Helicobacter sp. 11S02596-1]
MQSAPYTKALPITEAKMMEKSGLNDFCRFCDCFEIWEDWDFPRLLESKDCWDSLEICIFFESWNVWDFSKYLAFLLVCAWIKDF